MAGKFLAVITVVVIAAVINKGFPKTKDQWLMLSSDFAKDRLATADYSVNKLDDVYAASNKVWDFCNENNIKGKTRYILSLFVEEMGKNSVMYGFKNVKDHKLTINISCYKNCIKLRLRDNGNLFNPVKYLELYDNKNPEHNIGIKIATKMAKDVQYLNTFNLNNLILTMER